MRIRSDQKSRSKEHAGKKDHDIPGATLPKPKLEKAAAMIRDIVGKVKLRHPSWNLPEVRVLELL